jgi:hypothetical protein
MADFGADFQAAMAGDGGNPFAQAMTNAGGVFDTAMAESGDLETAGDAFMDAMQQSIEAGDIPGMDMETFEVAMDTMIDNIDMPALEATMADGGTFGDIMPMVQTAMETSMPDNAEVPNAVSEGMEAMGNDMAETMEASDVAPTDMADAAANYDVGMVGDNAGMTGNMDGVSGDVTDVQGDMTDVQGDMTGTNGDVTEMSGDFGGVMGDVTGMTGDVTFVTGDVSGIQGDMGDMFGDMTGIQGDMTDMQGCGSPVTGDVSGMNGDFTDLAGDVSGITGDVSAVSGDVSGIAGDVTDVSGNLTGVTGDLTDVAGDVTDVSGAIDDVPAGDLGTFEAAGEFGGQPDAFNTANEDFASPEATEARADANDAVEVGPEGGPVIADAFGGGDIAGNPVEGFPVADSSVSLDAALGGDTVEGFPDVLVDTFDTALGGALDGASDQGAAPGADAANAAQAGADADAAATAAAVEDADPAANDTEGSDEIV